MITRDLRPSSLVGSGQNNHIWEGYEVHTCEECGLSEGFTFYHPDDRELHPDEEEFNKIEEERLEVFLDHSC